MGMTQSTSCIENTLNEYLKPLAKNPSVLESVIRQSNRKLNNNNNRRRKEFDPDQPEQLRAEKQKIQDQQQNQQREQVKKKREEWSTEMQEMREIRGLRERTREQIRSSKASAAHEGFMATTQVEESSAAVSNHWMVRLSAIFDDHISHFSSQLGNHIQQSNCYRSILECERLLYLRFIRNMEKITSHHVEIRGWEDHDQTQPYITWYHRQQHYRSAQISPKKTPLEPQKTKAKECLKENYKLSSKHMASRKPSCKIIKEYKLKETQELQRDKMVLVNYLKQSALAKQNKIGETARKSIEKEVMLQQFKEQNMNRLNIVGRTNKNTLSNKRIVSLSYSNFKGSLQQYLPQTKCKPPFGSLKNKPLGQKTNQNVQKYRDRRLVNCYSKNGLHVMKSKQVERFDIINVKPKNFPLYYREMQEKQQLKERDIQRARKRLKLHKKKHKSQSSMLGLENEPFMKQFTDEKMVPIKKQS